MNHKSAKTIIIASLCQLAVPSLAQHKFADIMERPLILRQWGRESDVDSKGDIKHHNYSNNSETITFHANGTLDWNNKEKKLRYTYVIKSDTVAMTNAKDYWLKFFIPRRERGGVNDNGYIGFKDTNGVYRYACPSEIDCYDLYLKCTAEKRYDAAFDYLLCASKSDSPLALCALGYCYENGIGVDVMKSDGNVSYMMATYHINVPLEEQQRKFADTQKMLVESGLMDKSLLDVKLEASKLALDDRQKNIVLAFAYRRPALNYMPKSRNEEDYDENLSDVMEDFSKAISANNDAVSQFMLGRIYYEGLQGFAEKEQGLDLLNKAAAQNNIAALGYLAEICEKRGQKSKAMEYWQRAASQSICKPVFSISRLSTLASPNGDDKVNIQYLEKARKKTGKLH